MCEQPVEIRQRGLVAVLERGLDDWEREVLLIEIGGRLLEDGMYDVETKVFSVCWKIKM